jgi:hypothetical protein
MRDSTFLWVIKFNPEKQEEADLYIPAPPSFGGGWMKTRTEDEFDRQMLKYLGHIQDICENIKDQCAEETPENIAEAEDYLKKVKEVNHKLGDLDALFQKFNDFLKKLNKPPPPDLPKGDQPRHP